MIGHHAVRAELMGPDALATAMARRSIAYLPLGTLEWHGKHLPIGLDGLTAHGVCCEAALREGGIVLPALFYGTGGGHGAYPWTVMVEPGDIETLLRKTLERLEQFGIGHAILFSGHFAAEQVALIETVADRWNNGGGRMRVLGLAVSMAGLGMPPDHAALFETTLLYDLHPDLVRVELLPPLETVPAIDPGGDMGAQRHDPAHPLYGIFGPDPRRFDPRVSAVLLHGMVDWLLGEIRRP